MPAQLSCEGISLDSNSTSNESVPLLIHQQPPGLSLRNKCAFAVGHVLNDVCASIWFTYTLLFLHAVIGMPGANAGAILLLGQLVDGLATPLVGYLADRPLTGLLAKYGRRKLCHLIGTILVISSFPFIFIPCYLCDVPIFHVDQWNTTVTTTVDVPEVHWWQQTLFYSPFVILFQSGWAAVQISHLALIPQLCDSKNGYTDLTSIRFSITEVSTISVYFITWSILHITRKNAVDQISPEDAYKFRDAVLICVIIGALFALWFHITLIEPPILSTAQPQEPPPIEQELPAEVGRRSRRRRDPKLRTTRSYFLDPKLYLVAFLYVSGRLFNTLIQVFIPLYLDESLQTNAESVALVPLTIDLAGFGASLCVKYLNENCGRVFSYLVGAMFCLLAILRIYFGIPYGQESQIYLVAIMLGTGSSITMVTSLSLTADLIGINTKSGATVYSA